MRRPLLTVLGPLLFLAAQAQDPVVQSVLDALRIDSMMRYANELSGEVPVSIAGVPQTILSRHRDNAGNAVSQAYLEQKLVQFGYAPVVQSFSATGKNILVTKTGELYPDQYVVLCAHYDARPGPTGNAPAADDDGSGAIAVLDAARVLRDIPFAYSIVFALWDEEEFGLVGSAFYAGAMAANDELIRGVINMDGLFHPPGPLWLGGFSARWTRVVVAGAVVATVVVFCRAFLNSFSRSCWARAVCNPVPHSW